MPRKKNTIRPIEKTINIPEDVCARVDLQLYSAIESRVPHGAWSKLVQGLLKEWLTKVEAS